MAQMKHNGISDISDDKLTNICKDTVLRTYIALKCGRSYRSNIYVGRGENAYLPHQFPGGQSVSLVTDKVTFCVLPSSFKIIE